MSTNLQKPDGASRFFGLTRWLLVGASMFDPLRKLRRNEQRSLQRIKGSTLHASGGGSGFSSGFGNGFFHPAVGLAPALSRPAAGRVSGSLQKAALAPSSSVTDGRVGDQSPLSVRWQSLQNPWNIRSMRMASVVEMRLWQDRQFSLPVRSVKL